MPVMDDALHNLILSCNFMSTIRKSFFADLRNEDLMLDNPCNTSHGCGVQWSFAFGTGHCGRLKKAQHCRFRAAEKLSDE